MLVLVETRIFNSNAFLIFAAVDAFLILIINDIKYAIANNPAIAKEPYWIMAADINIFPTKISPAKKSNVKFVRIYKAILIKVRSILTKPDAG